MSACKNHPDLPAAAFCRTCGSPLCVTCQRFAQGTVFCQEHVPGPRTPESTGSPYTAPPPYPTQPPYSTQGSTPGTGASPGLAFLLGLIPGVGAIYNGQYAKGLVHVVIFGMLISIVSSDATGGLGPLFGIMIPAWVLYMAFESYHTAQKRQRGEAIDEFSSIVPMQKTCGPSRLPAGPMVLICVGILFLLNNLELIRFSQIIRYWPVFLIAVGLYMLYVRLSGEDTPSPADSANHATTVVDSGVPHE